MIFGIDFGTTYTVVAWYENDVLHFLQPVLKPTVANGVRNIKRLVSQQSMDFYKSDLYKNVCDFFVELAKAIEVQTKHDGLKSCVITVPARFNDIARNAIRAAAISAGFNVLKLITEPVAAAMHCVRDKQNGYYVVYDLGGGTFDATLLKLHDDVFQILAIDGLPDYGGIDIDALIASSLNMPNDEAILYKEKGDFAEAISNAIDASLEKTYKIIFDLIAEQGLDKKDIKQLILAGGSSRLANIHKRLAQDFYIQPEADPDIVVAAGAALYAKAEHTLIDVIPFNLGIEVLNDKIEILIPKNAALPCVKTEYFFPAHDGKVLINILQGTSDTASECVQLGSLEIAASDKFPVTFMLDMDGILSVKIDQRVVIVSNLFRAQPSTHNALIKDFLDRAKASGNQSAEALNFIRYLELASEIVLTAQAHQLLQENFVKIFEKK